MSDNLYAPPNADLDIATPPAAGAGDFDLRRCFAEGWERCWDNFPLWLAAGIVITLATVAASVTIIGIPFVLPILFWGAFYFFLRMYDGGAALGDLFSGFSRYGSALLPMLGFWLLLFVIGLPANGLVQYGLADPASPNYPLIALGYALSIVVGLFVTSRLTFAAFLIVDRDYSLGRALSEAWTRTGPLAGKVALLMLAMIAAILLGFVALCVGMIPASVVGYLAWTSAYRQIWGGPQPTA
jgi:hypothetical protein